MEFSMGPPAPAHSVNGTEENRTTMSALRQALDNHHPILPSLIRLRAFMVEPPQSITPALERTFKPLIVRINTLLPRFGRWEEMAHQVLRTTYYTNAALQTDIVETYCYLIGETDDKLKKLSALVNGLMVKSAKSKVAAELSRLRWEDEVSD